MRLLLVLAAAALVLLAGCVAGPIKRPPPTLDGPLATYGFADAVVPDAPDGFGSEPSLLATPDGTLYFTSVLGSATARGDGLWRSDDGGKTYLGKADYPFGGGDSDIDVLASGRLLLTGQWRPAAIPNLYLTGGESVSYSDDRGETWVPVPTAGYLPGADRNWLATHPSDPDVAYLVFNNLATGLMVGKTTDGGTTWVPPAVVAGTGQVQGRAGGPNGIAGDAVVDAEGRLYIPYGVSIGGGTAQRVYRSDDGGATFAELTVRMVPGNESAGAIFSTLALDAAGGLHYVWAETVDKTMAVLYARSSDHGETWANPVRITPEGVTAAFPWVVAGEAGHVAIGYYATAGTTTPDKAPEETTWVPVVTFASPGEGGGIVATAVEVTNRPNHKGPICTQGTECSGGRDLGDFFELAVLPGGPVAIVYADDAAEARTNAVAVQDEGPGLCPSLAGERALQMTLATYPCGG
jgi:hypothetical protein